MRNGNEGERGKEAGGGKRKNAISSPKEGLLLNTGFRVPRAGIGVWQAHGKALECAVEEAIRSGVRLIDGAAVYGNEASVGKILRRFISRGEGTGKEKEGGACEGTREGLQLKRDDLFIVSKLFNTNHVWRKGRDDERVKEAIDQTLEDLGLKWVDLYLIHWPFAIEQRDLDAMGGLRLPDGAPNPKLNLKEEYVDTWKIMVREVLNKGKARSLGVSNFTIAQLERLREESDVIPAVNQVELHLYLQQPELRHYCQSRGIQIMAYSPLGSGGTYEYHTPFPAVGKGKYQCELGGASLLKNSVVKNIAKLHGKSPAQICLRWIIQNKAIPIPKSVTPSRIRENISLFDFELSEQEMSELRRMDAGFRYSMGYQKGHYDTPNAPWNGE